MNPVNTKSGRSVISAFRSIFHDPKYSGRRHRPTLGEMIMQGIYKQTFSGYVIGRGGNQFQVCRNRDLKCTIGNRPYKYFTCNNTHRYIDVLPRFVKAYNDTVHSTTGMALSPVTDSEVLAIWMRTEVRRRGQFASRKQRRFVRRSLCASEWRRCGLLRLPN